MVRLGYEGGEGEVMSRVVAAGEQELGGRVGTEGGCRPAVVPAGKGWRCRAVGQVRCRLWAGRLIIRFLRWACRGGAELDGKGYRQRFRWGDEEIGDLAGQLQGLGFGVGLGFEEDGFISWQREL